MQTLLREQCQSLMLCSVLDRGITLHRQLLQQASQSPHFEFFKALCDRRIIHIEDGRVGHEEVRNKVEAFA